MNKILTQTNYFESDVNAYSSNEIPSILQNIQNKNNFQNLNFQSKISFDKFNHNSHKNGELKRFNTAKDLRRININSQKDIQNIISDDNNIIFAKKTDKYMNNNGKINFSNKKGKIANNNIIEKKTLNKNNEKIYNFKQINKNYNPKYCNSKNDFLVNNYNLLVDNNTIAKRISNNMINYNYDLGSTMPNKKIKLNNFQTKNKANNNKNLLLNNQNINKNRNVLNDSFLLSSKYSNRKMRNKILSNSKTFTDYKNKNKKEKNDLSWDYGIGLLNKGQKSNFYEKENNLKNKYNVSNYFSERKKTPINLNSNINNDDIDDKELDEIVNNLDLSFFNDEKRNNTVILNDKAFSDESLSDLADDIIKTFQEIENEDLNVQETVPSSSNPELEGIASTNDKQYNNNYHNQNKIIYETKSTIKPTIVNNFFISSLGTPNKNNKFQKDINYNLFVVNDYSKNNSNSNIPSLVTQTYQSPNILREEKNNKVNNINNFTETKMFDENKEFEMVANNNNIIKSQNAIIDNYSKNLNNNLLEDDFNNNQINNINNNLNSNIYYSNNKQIKNKIDNNIEYFNNNIVYKFNLNNSLKKTNKNNLNEIDMREPTVKELLTNKYNTINIKINKEKNSNFKEGFNKKLLNKNKMKPMQTNNLEDNINNNYSFNKSKNNHYNEFKQNSYKILDKNLDSENEINPISKTKYLSGNIYLNNNNKNILFIKNQNNINSNNILINNKKHISFNLDNNIFIKFKKDELITQSEIIKQNGEICNIPKKNMNLYKNELKLIKPKPIIKTFLKKDIKINLDYILVENLPERQILPDLYDDFEEDDIKSLEKSLERSVDKTLH